jgi:uncharacterized protein YciI
MDAESSSDIRAACRERHRAYIRREQDGCRCLLGGPLTDDEGEMIGTALVFEAPDQHSVMRFMAGDPYVKAGLFVRMEVDCWSIGLGVIQ